jgi:hypothetical protein
MVAGGYATRGTVTCADARRLGVTPRRSSALAQAVHKTNQQIAGFYLRFNHILFLLSFTYLFTWLKKKEKKEERKKKEKKRQKSSRNHTRENEGWDPKLSRRPSKWPKRFIACSYVNVNRLPTQVQWKRRYIGKFLVSIQADPFYSLQRGKYLSYVVFVRIRFCISLLIRK